MIVKLIAIFLITLFFNLSFTTGVSGEASQSAVLEVSSESVNPTDGISYVFKRVLERVNTFFAFSDRSIVNNYEKLLNSRLSELKYIIENKKMAYFEKSTQRYFTIAGQLTAFLTSKNLKDEYIPTKDLLLSHIPILTKLRDEFDFGTAEWRFVEDDINYIKEYAGKLSE